MTRPPRVQLTNHPANRPANHPAPGRRGAAMYALVMSVSLLVSVLALAGLTFVRVERRTSARGTDMIDARRHARSAVELGIGWVNANPNWRGDVPNGTWVSGWPIGDGTFTLQGTDPEDGDLRDDPLDPLRLVGIGVRGHARQKLGVTLDPIITPLSSLDVPLAAGDDLEIYDTVRADAPVTANDNIIANLALVDADVEATSGIYGSTYLRGRTTGTPPRTLPDTDDVFDDYLANGTSIALSDIPYFDGRYRIEGVVLSPTSNPYGGQTNPRGIYVIVADWNDLRVRDCRIVGTLVVLNPNGSTEISGSVHWEPAESNLPSCLVWGDLRLDLDDDVLSEQSSPWRNFNPPGTPFNGSEDADVADAYPSRLGGLFYASGDLTCTGKTTVEGLLIAGDDCRVSGTLSLTHRRTYFDDPPPGFYTIDGMQLRRGTWRREVD